MLVKGIMECMVQVTKDLGRGEVLLSTEDYLYVYLPSKTVIEVDVFSYHYRSVKFNVESVADAKAYVLRKYYKGRGFWAYL